MRKPFRDSNKTRKVSEERLRCQLERYHGKVALMETWDRVEYLSDEDAKMYLHLKREVHQLRQQLIVKGVL
jgi:hypothetical protein